MAAQQLGLATCPLCHQPAARASLSKNKLSVLTCTQTGCGIQLFTRSDAADERVRDLIATPADPTEPPAPAPETPPATKPQPVPTKGMGWGIFGA